jgi:Ca-activated chloride channel homolog
MKRRLARANRITLFLMLGCLIAVSLARPMLASIATASPVQLNAELGSFQLLADTRQSTYLKIGLSGARDAAAGGARTPVNIAIVLDRSGSMKGEKIRKAREAAIEALDKLESDDVVSVIAYNHHVNVVVPATKLSDRQAVYSAIRSLEADGNTALFGGVSKGAGEVMKFYDRSRVNRIILLSDGLANVGPSSTGELAALGASLIKDGISVTTIGLGSDYNEDLMAELAKRSDGNHYFVESADDLGRIFDGEFGNVSNVVAQEVDIQIRLGESFRMKRALGRFAEIHGDRIDARMNQLYRGQELFLLLEIESSELPDGAAAEVASIEVSYYDTSSGCVEKITGQVQTRFTSSLDTVRKSTNGAVMASAVELIATENNTRALVLRDQGNLVEARRVLVENVKYLEKNASDFKSKRLMDYSEANKQDSVKLDGNDWKEQRKKMREYQYYNDTQQLFH